MTHIIRAVLIVLLAAVVLGCRPSAHDTQLTEVTQSTAPQKDAASKADPQGNEYKQALIKAIRGADKIVVTEHSFDHDLYFPESEVIITPEIVYGTRELSDQQKALFVSTIEGLDPTTQDAFPGCIFAGHHTITFYSEGKALSRMNICFQCGEVDWRETKALPPWSLYGGLAKFIKAIGLEPERDWVALAKQYRTAANSHLEKE